jgi:hypothetical protein
MGEKEPFEDRSETHGACPSCEKKLMEQVEKMERAAKTKES